VGALPPGECKRAKRQEHAPAWRLAVRYIGAPADLQAASAAFVAERLTARVHALAHPRRDLHAYHSPKEDVVKPPKWLYFLLGLVAFELIADVFAKQFALSGKLIFAALAIVGFIAANLAWLIALRTGAELSKGAVLFSVLSGIGAVLIGLLAFHEKVSAYQLVGLALGVAAIAFLSVG